jgi:hypothetical protein
VGEVATVAMVAAESEDADDDKVAAAATPDPASTATADITPAPMIQPFFLGENRCALAGSWSFDDTGRACRRQQGQEDAGR